MTSYTHCLKSRKRERERERENGSERERQMHLSSCPEIELKIVNDNHGVHRAQNDHNFRDISRKHDTCLDKL